jgi:hypothetical protein
MDAIMSTRVDNGKGPSALNNRGDPAAQWRARQ